MAATMSHLADADVQALDSYAFMAVIGKRVIHPGGRCSTEELFERAEFQYSEAGLAEGQTTIGPFEAMTPAGLLGDEGFLHCLAIAGHARSRPAYLRRMAWLMPRINRAVPHLGYSAIDGTRPT